MFTKSGNLSKSPEKQDQHTSRSALKYLSLSSTTGGATIAKSSRFSGLNDWFQDSWALEYVCVGFSVACLIAILATLFFFDGLPLSAWHSTLSINTIFSILGTGMKGAALLAAASALGQLKWAWYCHPNRPLQDFQTFDNASRGPYGAFLLLLRVPYSNLACIGALVTIMSLASDAFVQASTSQPLRLKSVQSATIPVCHNYEFSAPTSRVDPLLKTALYAGIFNFQVDDNLAFEGASGVSSSPNTSSSSISPFCPTGNCTFPPYFSLAMRHQCSNITDMLRVETKNNASDYYLTASLQVPDYNQNLTATCFNDYVTNSGYSTTLNIASSDVAATFSNGSFFAGGLLISDVYIVMPDHASADFATTHFQAFHCNLHFGIQIYTASMSKGIFVETPGDFIPGNWTFSPDQYDLVGSWSMKANVSGIERQVTVGWSSLEDLATYFADFFAGSSMSAEVWDDPNVIIPTFYLSRDINDGTMGTNTIFSGVARSLTPYFRTATNATAQGWTHELEPHINVRWGFMIWPLVMVGLNFAFVIAASVQSHHRGIPSWRSSTLASMFTDSRAEEQGTATELAQHVLIGPPEGLGRISELEEWASTRHASLRYGVGHR